MPTADDVIGWFERNAGLAEDPVGSNCTWVSRWFYEATGRSSALAPGCYAWCAVTVSRAMNEAWGNPDVWQVPGIKPDWTAGFSYVPSVRRAFEAAGRFVTDHAEAQRGDAVIFDWDGDGWGDHIGVFVQDLGDGTCLTFEGNTADSDISQRRRPYSLIAGFCRVPYDQEAPFMALSEEEQHELLDAVRDLRADTFAKDVLARLASGRGDAEDYYADAVRTHGLIETAATVKGGPGGGAINLDALADKVADKLAERLRQ